MFTFGASKATGCLTVYLGRECMLKDSDAVFRQYYEMGILSGAFCVMKLLFSGTSHIVVGGHPLSKTPRNQIAITEDRFHGTESPVPRDCN